MNLAMKQATFSANKLATTVRANSFAAEAVVPQPMIKIPVFEEVEYEFDQQKFEEYVSSSSSRSASPCRCRKASSSRKIRWSSDLKTQEDDLSAVAVVVTLRNDPPASKETRSNVRDNSSKVKELPVESAPVLTKRARQRRRQPLAR